MTLEPVIKTSCKNELESCSYTIEENEDIILSGIEYLNGPKRSMSEIYLEEFGLYFDLLTVSEPRRNSYTDSLLGYKPLLEGE